MEKELEKVFEFNKLGGQDVTHTPRFIKEEDFSLQYGLIVEEMEELNFAYHEGNMVEVTDALVDISYVLFGMVCRLGLQNEFVKGFDLVNTNNMTKVVDEKGNVIVKFNEIGKIIKPEGYQSVNLGNNFPYLKTLIK